MNGTTPAPLTWILVVVRDRLALTRVTLESIRATTRPEYRLLAVDTGSGPETVDYLHSELRAGRIHRLVLNQAVPQWQKSFAIAQAVNLLQYQPYDFFAWIDNDMQMKKGWLEAAQAVLNHSDFEVVSCHNDRIQDKIHKPVARFAVAGHKVITKATANGAVWVMRRGFFDRWGPPPLNIGLGNDKLREDWYYSHKLRDAGKPFAVLSYSRHRGEKDSMRDRTTYSPP